MRFRLPWLEHPEHDERWVLKFAIFPVKLGRGYHHRDRSGAWIWMEFYYAKEYYRCDDGYYCWREGITHYVKQPKMKKIGR